MRNTPFADAKITAFSLLLPAGGFFSIPIIGAVTDNFPLYISWFVLCFAFLTFEILFACGGLWEPVLSIASFVIFSFSRPMFYTMGAVHVSRTFGFRTFGRLYGLLFTLSGLFSLCQYYLDYAVQREFHGDYKPIDYLLILPQLSTFSLPIYLYVTRPRSTRKTFAATATETRVYAL